MAKNGKPGITRLQLHPWTLTADVACLKPRTTFSRKELFVMAALIERQCWRFGYGRTASEGRLTELRLLDGLGALIGTHNMC